MLKLENISIELKNINKEMESWELAELIKKIDQEVREQTTAQKPSEKKQLNAIKKYLKESEKNRPLLGCYTPFDDRVAFTNSYSLFILDKKTLPFNVAFTTNEEKEKFLTENEIPKELVKEGCYPNLKNVIPDEWKQLDTLKLNIESFLAWYKVQNKKEIKNKNVLYNLADDLEPYTVDPELLKGLIDILQISGDIMVEYYGPLKPCIIRKNAGREIGLLLPVKKY